MLSTKLKSLRKSRGITQATLAQTLGLTQQSVAQWECNKSEPTPSTLLAIAKYFNVTVDFLLDNERTAPSFTEEELRLVENYRQLQNSDRTLIVSVLDKFTQAAGYRQTLIDQSNNSGSLFNVNVSNNILTAR